MARTALKGTPVGVSGDLPAQGTKAQDFKLVAGDLSDKSLADYGSKYKILSIFPSVDTPTCAQALRHFHQACAGNDNCVVLNISRDLPFAAGRFCAAEGLDGVHALSGFRSEFGQDYGVELTDGPLRGLYARCVIVLDPENNVLHSQLVPEIADEPDYEAVLAVLP